LISLSSRLVAQKPVRNLGLQNKMAMSTSQMAYIFKDFVARSDVEASTIRYRGNVEKCFEDLIKLIPKDKRSKYMCDKMWGRLKQYWRVRIPALSIQEAPSNSITVTSIGTLRKYQYVRAIGTAEIKAGKIWVKHSAGWSLATRKGEVRKV